MPDVAAFDLLATPVAWTGADGRLEGANAACARWLGVSAKRLAGVPLVALEFEGDAFARAISGQGGEGARLRRVPLAFPGTDTPRFADIALTAREGGGWWLEAHPVEEFPGDDPALMLPSALSAALKGLAHELRNPLAGLKGAAQLLDRRVADDATARELTWLNESEVDRDRKRV